MYCNSNFSGHIQTLLLEAMNNMQKEKFLNKNRKKGAMYVP